jgi:NADH-quinone oxidoreductase subunit L
MSDGRYTMGWWVFVAGFIASLPVLWQVTQSADPIRIVLFAWPWKILPVVELSIDRLAAIMMVVISGIGTLLYRYSTRYMQQDAGHPLYQTMLALAVSSLLFMVSSADLVTLFISWQLLSWLLSLLSHNYSHGPTAQASFRTFIMLRAGDIAFLAGIVLAYHLYGTVQFAPLFERAVADPMQLALLGGLKMSGATAVALLIFIGAMSKSAQVPLHMWLPDSLYAPTPIHALLHAGIINAGGFLLNRLAPLYALSSTTLHVVFAVGLVTAIVGASMMLVQNDIKKTLGYSTIGQMGYMIMECGLGAFSLAVFHLIAHGLFKASIFLNCGDVIHQNRHERRDSPESPRPPTTTACYDSAT